MLKHDQVKHALENNNKFHLKNQLIASIIYSDFSAYSWIVQAIFNTNPSIIYLKGLVGSFPLAIGKDAKNS